MIHNYSICILFFLEVGDVRPAPDQPHHDVAGPSLDMDLFKAKTGGGAGQGLGQGLEAQMWRRTLARWRKSQLLERWLVAVQLTSCHDRLTGTAPDSRIGGSPAASLTEPVMFKLARRSLRPGVKLTWTYASQAGLSCTSRAGITIKLFLWAGISIKTFHSSKIEESNRARECPRFYL
jgi:hypothetical protein